jgi:hypothetical protein
MSTQIKGETGVSQCQPGSVSAGDFGAGAINPATDITYTQTWQDMGGSRSIGGGPYTNSTGQPIKVAVAINGTTGALASSVSWSVAGVIRGYQTTAISNGTSYIAYTFQLYFEVPAGATYSVNNNSTTNTVATWMELR